MFGTKVILMHYNHNLDLLHCQKYWPKTEKKFKLAKKGSLLNNFQNFLTLQVLNLSNSDHILYIFIWNKTNNWNIIIYNN